MTYEEAVATHEWRVPERYNIAEDVCDKHPADKLAMIHEHFDGTVREVRWGELQELSNRFANALTALGVGQGRPRRDAAAADARDRGGVLRHLEDRRDPALDVGALRRRRHPPPGLDSEAKVLVTNEANRDRVDPNLVEHVLVLDDDVFANASPDFERVDTLADDPAQLYYTSGTTGLAKGIVHAHRYLLAHEEFVYCHDVQDGERFHGMGEWAWAAGIAPLLGPWRFGAVQLVLSARGRLRSAQAARLPLPPRGVERLHHADRDALDDGHLRRGHARTHRSSGSSAARASRSTPRRSAGSASSTG